MWFKNLAIYRLIQWNIEPAELEEKLVPRALTGCGSMDMQVIGWVPPKPETAALVHLSASQLLICLGVEKKLLPSSVINQFAKQRALDIEEQQGYKPGRRQLKEIKEAVTDELLPRAFAIRRQTYAWIDPVAGFLVIDAASPSKADELLELLFKSVDGIAIEPLHTNRPVVSAMTSWLAGEELPSNFTVDRDCELRGTGDEKATVRYVRHALEPEEVSKHINGGKEVTRLALTWADRLSFVLHEGLLLKKLAPLDIVKDQLDVEHKDELFDADFVLMTGELKQLLPDLIDILGGEAERGIVV